MFTRILMLFFLLAHIVGCQQHDKPKTDCNQLSTHTEVVKLGVEDLYKEAMWQLYKFNIIESNKYRVDNPLYIDSVYTETSLAEFNLDFHSLEQIGDTTVFVIFFERGVNPIGSPYNARVAFWNDTQKLEIGDRYRLVTDRKVYESEFNE